MYHHFEDPVSSDVSCTPQDFESHMIALKKAGFTFLNVETARFFLLGSGKEIKKPILVTFDDGYESNYLHAFPVALKLKIPLTVFVITSRIGLKPQFTKYLSEDQIKEMALSGLIDFGSHTHDLHTKTLTIFRAFRSNPNPVLRLLSQDLQQSKKRLFEITGKEVISLAWPYGNYNSQISKIAFDCGFLLHFTSRNGYNEPGSDPFGIKRIPITSRDNVESVLRKARGGN
ncbi:polysaccharide deacetylase family protein [bacterium]|nr:polysaccharide deacetylase family protein [bacterium]